MKRYIATILVVLLLGSRPAFADERPLINTKLVKSEPVNLLRYFKEQIDYLAEIFKRLQQTGKPLLMFNKEDKAGLEVTLAEDWPKGTSMSLVEHAGSFKEPGKINPKAQKIPEELVGW